MLREAIRWLGERSCQTILLILTRRLPIIDPTRGRHHLPLRSAASLTRHKFKRKSQSFMNPSDCPSCGKTNPSGARFCAACGSRFPLEDAVDSSQPSRAAPYGLAQVDGAAPKPKAKKQRPSSKRIAVLLVLAIGIGLGAAELIYLVWNRQAQEPEREAKAMLLAE